MYRKRTVLLLQLILSVALFCTAVPAYSQEAFFSDSPAEETPAAEEPEDSGEIQDPAEAPAETETDESPQEASSSLTGENADSQTAPETTVVLHNTQDSLSLTITGTAASLQETAAVEISPISADSAAAGQIQSVLPADDERSLYLFEIRLLDSSGSETEPTGTVQADLEIPLDAIQAETEPAQLALYHIQTASGGYEAELLADADAIQVNQNTIFIHFETD